MVDCRNEKAEREIVACLYQDIPRVLSLMDEYGVVAADCAPYVAACIRAAEKLAAKGHEFCDWLSLSDMLDVDEPIQRAAIEKMAIDCYEQGGLITMLRWAVSEVAKSKKKHTIADVLNAGLQGMSEVEPDNTIASVVAGLSGIEFSASEKAVGLEALQDERQSYKDGMLKGVPSYYYGKRLGMLWPEKRNGDLIVLGGRSSDGKTTMMLNDVYADGERGIPCGVIELEMPKHRLIERMACKMSAINPMWFKNAKWSKELGTRFDEAYRMVESWPIVISDEPSITMDQLEAKAFILRKRNGIRSLYVDYLQLITPTSEESRQGTRAYITQWSRRLKLLARDLGIPVYVLSQLARTEDTRDGELTPAMPTKETLKESGSIEQDSDVVLLICKKPRQPRSNFTFMQDYWEMLISVDKNREGPTGILEHVMFPACYNITETGTETTNYLLRYDVSKKERGY